MINMLPYYFLADTLKELDSKYQSILDNSLEKTFLYANFIEITKYYDGLSFKKSDRYQITKRLQTSNTQIAINYLKNECINNEYNSNILLFLCAFVANIILNSYLQGFTKGQAKHLKFLELEIYKIKTNHKTYQRFKMIDFFQASLTLTESDQRIIGHFFEYVYHFSYGLEYFKKSLTNFKKVRQDYQKDFLGFKALNLKIKGKIKKDNSLKYLIINPKNKHDYLNLETRSFDVNNQEKNLTFHELYQEAKQKACQAINELCEEIFYHKNHKKGLVKQL